MPQKVARPGAPAGAPAAPAFSGTRDLARGYSIALVSAVILSTTAILIRYLTETYQMPALVLAFWREVFTALTLSAALLLFRPALLRARRTHLPYLAVYGLVLAIFNSLWTLSVALNGAAVSTVLVYSSAAFTALLGRWLLKERLDAGRLLVVALSLVGCLLVSGASHAAAWQSNLLGIFTGLVSGLAYAVYSLMGRSAAQRGLNPWTTLLYTFAIAALILGLVNLVAGGLLPGSAIRPDDLLWLGGSLAGWGALLLLAAGPTLLGYGLYMVSLSHLPSSVANLIVTLEPAFTAGLAYLVLGERLGAEQLTGALIILGGVAFLRAHEVRVMRIRARTAEKTPA